MQLIFHRRTFIIAGLAAATVPAIGRQRTFAVGKKELDPDFSHGVASGEPGQTSMLLWTRYVGKPGTRLRLYISEEQGMSSAKLMGETIADPERDHTARLVIHDLSPGTTYYYRWVVKDGGASIIGRTRTLPAINDTRAKLAIFGAASMPGGWFNAYAHAAEAGDFDLWVHLGNYIHQEQLSAVPGRANVPSLPPKTVEQFRARYRAYRSDPLLQKLHARHPMVALFDNDDLYQTRSVAELKAARQAFQDWMPVSDELFARYELGRLAVLYRCDARRFANPPLQKGNRSLAELRDDEWVSGRRQMLGNDQEKWLLAQMKDARTFRWQLLAQQRMMANIITPRDLPSLASPAGKQIALAGAENTAAGLPMALAQWSGYPAARARVLSTAQQSPANLINLVSGQGNAWGIDLDLDGRPAGVELATPSVTNPGAEAWIEAPTASVVDAFRSANPTIRYVDLAHRGYLYLTIDAANTAVEWRFTAPVTALSSRLDGTKKANIAAGARRLSLQ